jgi:O-methyltransferase
MMPRDFIARTLRRFRRRLERAPVTRDSKAVKPEYELDWTYDADGLRTVHNCDFMKDPLFAESYKLGKATGSWGDFDIQWRVYVVCWTAAKARHLPGDYVECGVNKGGYSRAAMRYIDFANLGNKKFYLVDTYNGVPQEFLEEENRALIENRYSDCYEETQRTFAPFKNAILVRGVVPYNLPEIKAEKVCYLSIDMNSAAPSIAAAEFFWDKMSSGAVMVLDDYGFSMFYRQKLAFDEFARGKNVAVLSLPTGQGLIFKP